MGYGSYSSSDWSKLRTSRKLDTASTNEIFSRRGINPKFDPCYIGTRESRDSDDHPESTPIMVGVDVTGSMGYLSTSIIKESLNELMMKLYSTSLVKDPQLLFAGIGDVDDSAPLQVTQFESDIRIAEQLMDIWIEGRGGDGPEDYELMWYFAANHTSIDSFEKRGQKGFCFTIGDAPCHDTVSSANIKKIFSDDTPYPISSKRLADEAGKKYELFHILIDGDSSAFNYILPGRVIKVSKQDIKYLPEIIISAIQITKGSDAKAVISQWDELARPIIGNALSDVQINSGKKITF